MVDRGVSSNDFHSSIVIEAGFSLWGIASIYLLWLARLSSSFSTGKIFCRRTFGFRLLFRMSKPCLFSIWVRLTWSFSFSYGDLLLFSLPMFLVVVLIPPVIVTARVEACSDMLRLCVGQTIDNTIDLKTEGERRYTFLALMENFWLLCTGKDYYNNALAHNEDLCKTCTVGLMPRTSHWAVVDDMTGGPTIYAEAIVTLMLSLGIN